MRHTYRVGDYVVLDTKERRSLGKVTEILPDGWLTVLWDVTFHESNVLPAWVVPAAQYLKDHSV